jgi:hypothetical protein
MENFIISLFFPSNLRGKKKDQAGRKKDGRARAEDNSLKFKIIKKGIKNDIIPHAYTH